MGPMELLRKAVTGVSIESQISSQTFAERLTESARNAIAYAREESQQRGDASITVGDLLAGLSMEESTRAERIGQLKANAYYLRWLSGLPSLPNFSSLPDHGASCEPEADGEVRKALAFAVVEADRDREYWIDTDHILRGIMRFPNKAHFAVLKTEFNLEAARIASRIDREEHLPDDTPSLKVVSYLVRKHIALWVPPLVSLACYLYILIQTAGVELAPLAK